MGSTHINYPTTTDEYDLYLQSFDYAITLELKGKAMITATCEHLKDWNKTFETNFDVKKSTKLVRALEILLEREGKQLEEIYKSIENDD